LAIAGLTAPLTAAFLIADRRAAAPCWPRPCGGSRCCATEPSAHSWTRRPPVPLDPGRLVLARHPARQPAGRRRHAGAVQPRRGRRLSRGHARPAPDRGPMVADGAFRPNW